MTTRPAVTALLDQAEAASRDALSHLAALAATRGGHITYETPSRIVTGILTRLAHRGMTGQLTTCRHLTDTAPQPMFWHAWRPGRLRCLQCATRIERQTRGTPEDRRCDHCHHIRPTIYACAAQLPAVVAELPGILAAAGPVTVVYGLCPPCHHETQRQAPR